ncbi:hypothetical protein DXG03_008468 [Asterophora parasitica]|uniref:Copper homeostasis protein cutC homolog n=1 Tax=Asterophora parasitica TaxID=117018 RepID=A0A9P7KGE7_9AGAR|nr:hypothetical protein DXG03_008468 [Asterophora parasitica]
MSLVSSIVIEVCVDSVQSAITAKQAGADRLELCANLGLGGGTTPSLGLLKAVQRAAMVRPRTGDFLYSDEELEVILEDIRIFKESGVRGIVVGVLDKDGRVDVERMKQIVDEALPLEVCFHRAFDMTRDADEGLADIEGIGGISRILTSGQGKSVPEALSTLESLFRTTRDLIENEPWGLSILPGSGINPETVGPILDALLPLGLREIHLSGGGWIQGDMAFKREGMGMGVGGDGEWGVWTTDGVKVREVREIADARREHNVRDDGH